MPHMTKQILAKLNAIRVKRGYVNDMTVLLAILPDAAEAKLGKNYPLSAKKILKQAMALEPKKRTEFFKYMLEATPGVTYATRHGKLDKAASEMLAEKPEITILDVGSGFEANIGFATTTKSTLDHFKSEGKQTTAVAIDSQIPSDISGLETKGVIHIKMDAMEDDIEVLGKFNYVRCMNVLYYYNEEKKATIIKKLESILEIGGILVENSMCTFRSYQEVFDSMTRIHVKRSEDRIEILDGDNLALKQR